MLVHFDSLVHCIYVISDVQKRKKTEIPLTETEQVSLCGSILAVLIGVEVGIPLVLDLMTLPVYVRMMRNNIGWMWRN